MPQGAEDAGRLARIEDRLVAEDPGFVESFRRWRLPPGRETGGDGTTWISLRTGLVLLVGLFLLAVGPVVAIVLACVAGLVLCCRLLGRHGRDEPPRNGNPRFGPGFWST